MKMLHLPAVIKEKKIGKNLIVQHLAEQLDIKSESIEVSSSHLIVNIDYGRLGFIQKGKSDSTGAAKVISTNKKPALNNIYDLELSWQKYPGLNCEYNPEEVIESWKNTFTFKEEVLDKNIFGLRKPQIAAMFNVLSHWRTGDNIGTVVMPTGTGKTETMLSLLISERCGKLLVIVPTDPLREQIANKFITLGHLQNPLFNIVSPEAQKPIVGVLCENFKTINELKEFVNQCNVIVSTMDLISELDFEQKKLLAEKATHIFFDEAHHVKAPTWLSFRNLAKPEKVVQFTATPFRNDGQSIDGEFIFNYSLRKAQEDGYFKRINLIQVNEWDEKKADKVIADRAIEQLRSDLVKYDHILMARCKSQPRADAIHKLYEQYTDFESVVIHTGKSKKERDEAKEKIFNRTARIVVCVDMLGEGFDLPNLKIAAFHDIRKSLPITVQLAGRFTRTKYDEELGDASIIVNLKDSNVTKELEEFYALGADWNTILPTVSTSRINKELDFGEFLKGFKDLDRSKIPFQGLTPALSTVVYKNNTDTWFPGNFAEGIPKVDDLDYLFPSLNSDKKTLVIITGKKAKLDWGVSKDIYDIIWTLYVIHWDTKSNLLFINASDNAGLYRELAVAIIGEEAEIINKINIFKAFYKIERVRLQNVGLKEFLGKNRSFTMHTGFDIEKALEAADQKGSEKAFVAGVGYEDGLKISLGCSYKGRIWSHRKGDIQELVEFCTAVGKKLIRTDIDPNIILKDTLTSTPLPIRPAIMPFAVDWDEEVFLEPETRISFIINDIPFFFYETELLIINPSEDGDLLFELVTPSYKLRYKQVFFNNGKFDDYKIVKLNPTAPDCKVVQGKREILIEEFLYENPMVWWFVDGSVLFGNDYTALKQLIPGYPKDHILGRIWDGVNLSKESQKIDPKETDSIQYHIIQELKNGDYDIIYDDDYSGEIADVITIKQFPEYVQIQLYHLKFAKTGTVSQRIDDLYEVCGQAMKSVNWKFKEPTEFFGHLLRREIKKRGDKSCSRIEHGDKDTLTFLWQIVKKCYPVEFEVFIIQPGLSAKNPSVEQLNLLGVTSSYLRNKADIGLTVIGSNS